MTRTRSWMYLLVALAVVTLALTWVATMPVAINLVAPPSRGVSREARITTALTAMALTALIGLVFGISAHTRSSVRKAATVTGITTMVIVGSVLGVIALFSAGF